MILCHIRSLTAGITKEYHGKIDINYNTCSIYADGKQLNFDLNLTDIKYKYPDKDICLIAYLAANSEVGLLVYTNEEKNIINNFKIRNQLKGILYVYVPKEASSFLDCGVRVMTRENKNTLDKEYNLVQLFYNEFNNIIEEDKLNETLNFFIQGANPWSKAYAIFGGIEIDEKKI